MNVKLVLEYDGADFAGWQLQTEQRTVEGELRAALARLPLTVERLYAAGRTDAGAHAEGQVVSFHCRSRIPAHRLRTALNAYLPPDIAVLDAGLVPVDFHARYSARWRRYRYRYLDRASRPALDRDRCWHLSTPLHVPAMGEAVRWLLGHQDWTALCTAGARGDRLREIREAVVTRNGRFVDLSLVGEGFLRGMVRGVAGALAEIGLLKRPPEWLADLLRSRDRRRAPKPAPAAGLTLVEVEY
jgi:tRNA pseudouridine38-40 synthase